MKTAQALLCAAKTVTDQAIAAQLKAFAVTTGDDSKRLRSTMQSIDPLLALNASAIHEVMDSIPQQLPDRADIEVQPKVDPSV